MLLHLWASPYTKVEESFNIQAIHDILVEGIPVSDVSARLATEYDHIKFPGPVPRTFIGPLVLAAFARPFVALCSTGKQLQILGTCLFCTSDDRATNTTAYSPRRAWAGKCRFTCRFPTRCEPSLRTKCRILVHHSSSEPVPHNVLCFSDIAKLYSFPTW